MSNTARIAAGQHDSGGGGPQRGQHWELVLQTLIIVHIAAGLEACDDVQNVDATF